MRHTANTSARYALIVMMVFTVFGCKGSTPPVTFYTLTPIPAIQNAGNEQAILKDVLIGIGPLKFPKILDRPQIVTRPALENAIASVATTGGSTNAVLHLLAVAHEYGVDLTLEDFQAISHRTPLMVSMKPGGLFVAADLVFDDELPVLMTEKDAVKCEAFAPPHAWVVPVTAEVATQLEIRLKHALGGIAADGQETA